MQEPKSIFSSTEGLAQSSFALLRGRRHATPDALLQPLQQRGPDSRHSVSRCQPRSQRVLRERSAKGDKSKDKSGEKLAESEEDLLEHRTDDTDAFDTLFFGCEKFPYRDSFSLNIGGLI